MDFSKMSDEELEALAKKPTLNPKSEPLDFSSMTDEDLQRIAVKTPGWESGLRGLAQGASFGFADEIAGGAEAMFTGKPYAKARDESRANFKKARNDNPGLFTTGEIGGAIGSAMIPGVGAGGSLLRAGGTAAALGVAGGIGASEAEDAGGIAWDGLKGGGTGLALGSAGYGLAKGAQKLAPIVGEGLKLTPKANQAEIIEAAKRLGIKPTPGMLFEDKVLGGVESSLSQSPSLPGMLVRKTTAPVEKALDDVASKALTEASPLSQFATGQKVKSGLAEAIETKFKPSREIYESLAQSTPHMEVNAKSLSRVGKNIQNLDDVKLMPNSSGASKARQYSEYLQNVETVSDLKRIRQAIGAELRDASAADKPILGEMYARLTKLEQNSMMRSAVDTARSFARKPTGKTGDKLALDGEEIGRDMVSQLRGANKSYASEMGNIRDLSKNAGLRRSNSPSEFRSNIDALDSEKIADTLFNPGDYRVMQTMKAQFPKEAELLRQAQLAKIETGVRKADGTLSTPNFLRKANKLGDEAGQELFGSDKIGMIGDAQKVMQSLPEYIGPSGTPQGIAFSKMLNVPFQVSEAAKYAGYKGMTMESTQKVADYLLKSPQIKKLADTNPKAFQSMVLDFSKRVASDPSKTVPRAAQNELDRDSSTSSNYTPSGNEKDDDAAKDKFIRGN